MRYTGLMRMTSPAGNLELEHAGAVLPEEERVLAGGAQCSSVSLSRSALYIVVYGGGLCGRMREGRVLRLEARAPYLVDEVADLPDL